MTLRPSALKYDPAIKDHPAYKETPEFQEKECVDILRYNGIRTIRNDQGEKIGRTEVMKVNVFDNVDSIHQYSRNKLVKNGVYVIQKDGPRTLIQRRLRSEAEWIPTDRIVSINIEATKKWNKKLKKMAERKRDKWKRQNRTLDGVMDTLISHAKEKADEVWGIGNNFPEFDKICFFWNRKLQTTYGKAYYTISIPDHAPTESQHKYAIGIRPSYYKNMGIEHTKETVRHELIHIWQYYKDVQSGHGPSFKKWLPDLNVTYRTAKNTYPK